MTVRKSEITNNAPIMTSQQWGGRDLCYDVTKPLEHCDVTNVWSSCEKFEVTRSSKTSSKEEANTWVENLEIFFCWLMNSFSKTFWLKIYFYFLVSWWTCFHKFPKNPASIDQGFLLNTWAKNFVFHLTIKNLIFNYLKSIS